MFITKTKDEYPSFTTDTTYQIQISKDRKYLTYDFVLVFLLGDYLPLHNAPLKFTGTSYLSNPSNYSNSMYYDLWNELLQEVALITKYTNTDS